tara:strand:- start:17609 stop:18241 length:633 start_codon:yes stop_codon:yes gene_type:complete
MNKNITLPKGIVTFSQVETPSEKYDKYTISVKYDAETAVKVKKIIDDLYAEAIREAQAGSRTKVKEAGAPYNELLDDEQNETGEIIVNASLKAGGTRKDGTKWRANPPALVDGKGKKISGKINMGSGSEVQLGIQARDYNAKEAGLQLKLQVVCIHKLVQFGQADAGSFNFEYAEDAYEFDEADAQPLDQPSAPTSDDNDNPSEEDKGWM